MSSYKRMANHLMGLNGIVLLLLVLIANVALSHPYKNNIYIWQRKWDSHLQDSINVVGMNKQAYFTALAGEFGAEGNRLSFKPIDIKWPFFTITKAEVTVALRLNSSVSKLLSSNSINSTANRIASIMLRMTNSDRGGRTVRFQFDYDCPTSKLQDYANLLRLIREQFQSLQLTPMGWNLSITALPTWLQSKDFAGLIKLTDYYVLQLHSFETPKNVDDASKIFSREKSLAYINKATEFNRPYYVSLPTYGYDMAFTKDNTFIGLKTEQMQGEWSTNVNHKIVITDPEELISFVREIKTKRPKNLLGFYWFRIPIKSDEFNWNIKTLSAVLADRQPVMQLEVQSIEIKPGLYEIFLINSGEQNVFKQVGFNINWKADEQPIYDVLGKFNASRTENGMQIYGYAPYADEKILVAWLRNFDKTKKININTSKVSINENT